MSNMGQHRYPLGFDIIQNLGIFCFHKLYKFYKFQMSFKAFGKLIIQGLKQPFNFTHHSQMWQNLNHKVGFVNHILNPHGMWNPTIKNLSNNT